MTTPEEFRAAEEVQREAWGFSTDSPVPAPMQRAIADNGGLVLGAFATGELVGVSLGFLGREGATLFHYSHITGVRPRLQNRQVGRTLKLAQRNEVLRQGLEEVRWTFDPLQSRNAFLNVRVLGGTPDRYLPRYYGAMGDAINEGLETDRLRLVWRLNDPRVVARVAGERPGAADDQEAVRRASALLETAIGPAGLRRPGRVFPPTAEHLHLEIPTDLATVRDRDRGSPRRWREATREAFSVAFAAGYRVDDFVVLTHAGERRSFYLLERRRGSNAA